MVRTARPEQLCGKFGELIPVDNIDVERAGGVQRLVRPDRARGRLLNSPTVSAAPDRPGACGPSLRHTAVSIEFGLDYKRRSPKPVFSTYACKSMRISAMQDGVKQVWWHLPVGGDG
jgi:hypothetical protein